MLLRKQYSLPFLETGVSGAFIKGNSIATYKAHVPESSGFSRKQYLSFFWKYPKHPFPKKEKCIVI
jgi:hypothetical protein